MELQVKVCGSPLASFDAGCVRGHIDDHLAWFCLEMPAGSFFLQLNGTVRLRAADLENKKHMYTHTHTHTHIYNIYTVFFKDFWCDVV